MDLTQIRYFLALSKTLNFTRASKLCHVTQPALTKSIQRLEEEFGGQLLLREGAHTQLTPLGIAMLPLLQQTYDAAESARLGARNFRQVDVARFRVGLGSRVEPAVIAPLIDQLARKFTGLEVTMLQGEPKILSEWLLSSDIDVTLTEAGDQLTERANRWIVFADPVVVLLPEGHELARAEAIDAEQLRGYSLVGRTGEEVLGCGLESAFGAQSAGLPGVRHRGATEEHIHTLVRGGHGIALSTARRVLPLGIVHRPLSPHSEMDVFVAALAGRPMSRAADAFLRLARARDWESPRS